MIFVWILCPGFSNGLNVNKKMPAFLNGKRSGDDTLQSSQLSNVSADTNIPNFLQSHLFSEIVNV